MSVFEHFFDILEPDLEEEKAYEAPEDLASAAEDDVDALNEAAEEVDVEEGEAIEESDVTDSEETTEEESSEEEYSDEAPAEDSEVPAEDEEYADDEEEPLPEEEEVLEDSELEYEKKLNVFENTKQLLSLVTQNKESFELRFGKGLTPELSKEYRLIAKNFDDFIQVAESALTKKYSNRPYNTLMKYYVSLSKVYDIIIRMTENFVAKYNAEIEN